MRKTVSRQLVERELARIADVHRQMLAGLGQQHEPADEVVDVAKAPGLSPVSKHGQRLALQRLPDKRRNGAAVVGRASAGRRC